jgi:hypothetical protein
MDRECKPVGTGRVKGESELGMNNSIIVEWWNPLKIDFKKTGNKKASNREDEFK